VITNNNSDLILYGPGFFAANVPAGNEPGRVCYTRDGAFQVDREGFLVTASGHRVLGEGGPVNVGDDEFHVGPDGAVKVGERTVDRLLLVEFDNPGALRKEGNYYLLGEARERPAADTTVAQGSLESSNVNVVDEMTNLMSLMRIFEAGQKLIQVHDDLLNKAVNQVGSLR
ncbi:MAG: flagellar biosynthesis protein FlgE, partial [Firmicutes bacterium]|nr:flagellar biosynthesis protein FlgE [Bacillota bacterium]